MRHRKRGRALNRTQSHRKLLLGNLITSLFLHEKIRTTKAKAKEARPLAEKMITFAKRGDLHARRQVLRIVQDKDVVSKLFETLGARFKERPGGYTRIIKLGNRAGDNAPMALLELMPEIAAGKSGGRKRKRGKKKAAVAPEAASAADQAQVAVAAGDAEGAVVSEAEKQPVEDKAQATQPEAQPESPANDETPKAATEDAATEEPVVEDKADSEDDKGATDKE